MPSKTSAFRIWAAALALCASASHAQDQVYRCGESSLYTDKACEDARPVDLRSNMMQAGPRVAPVPDSDQPAPPAYQPR